MEDKPRGLTAHTLARVLNLDRAELPAALWSWLYFFCILSGYYILRPLRDEMGLAGGIRNIPWLWTGTLTVMLVAHPLFTKLVAKLPRAIFIGFIYRFFAVNLLAFFVLLTLSRGAANIWIGRIFYVWTSVFNLFVVSVFWALMVDSFRSDEGKRVFGFIALGGTLGAVVGAGTTALLATVLGPINLIPIAIVLVEAAVHCAKAVIRRQPGRSTAGTPTDQDGHDVSVPASRESDQPKQPDGEHPIGGSIWAGLQHTLRSRYLMGIMLFILLFTVTSSLVYFQQAEIIAAELSDRARRTAMFATIDLAVNLVTMATQLFLTSRALRRLGVAVTLAILPAVSLGGFLLLGLSQTLPFLVGFQVLRRSSNYALSRPAREILFTVLKREDKYKAKNLIDTLVYRTGDQIGAWFYAVMILVGFTLAGISFVAVALCVGWLALALWLGGKQRVLGQPGTRGAYRGYRTRALNG